MTARLETAAEWGLAIRCDTCNGSGQADDHAYDIYPYPQKPCSAGCVDGWQPSEEMLDALDEGAAAWDRYGTKPDADGYAVDRVAPYEARAVLRLLAS